MLMLLSQFTHASFEIEHLGAREIGIGGISSIADHNSSGLIINPIGGLHAGKNRLGIGYQNLFGSWASVNGLDATVVKKNSSWTIGYLELAQQELNYSECIIDFGYALKLRRLSLGLGGQVTEVNHLLGGGKGYFLNLAAQFEVHPRFSLGLLCSGFSGKIKYQTGSIVLASPTTYLGSCIDITADTKFFVELVNFAAMRLGVEKNVGANFAIRGGINENGVPAVGFSLKSSKLRFEYGLVLNKAGNTNLLNIGIDL